MHTNPQIDLILPYKESCLMIDWIDKHLCRQQNFFGDTFNLKFTPNTLSFRERPCFSVGEIIVGLSSVDYREQKFCKEHYHFIMDKWGVFILNVIRISPLSCYGHPTEYEIYFNEMSRIIEEPKIVIDLATITECPFTQEESIVL